MLADIGELISGVLLDVSQRDGQLRGDDRSAMIFRDRRLHPRLFAAGGLTRWVGVEWVDHRCDLVCLLDRFDGVGGRCGREPGDVLARRDDDDELRRGSACLGEHSPEIVECVL
jgi:hypothetical protein